ncbi:type II secretion system minor pseudopilin GspI [Ideonella sp. BN130291]|uniref:type II secretion system minor pseudopilin GspI n=1 Tax=Ideonella sp. BN130291 TaxID=3112940 RepID=UPI002E25CBF9|nr:type II secretion system minor pseudopilin GspI [Ideonella sp. BN130291]
MSRPGAARKARPGVRSRRDIAPQHGFTLIEVLVAVAIVAVTLTAGIKAAGALVNNAQRLTDVSAAQWCADNQLTELKLMRNTPGVGDTDFACEQLGRRYAGHLVVRPTPNPNFRRVDAVMADEAGVPLVTLSTVLPTRP